MGILGDVWNAITGQTDYEPNAGDTGAVAVTLSPEELREYYQGGYAGNNVDPGAFQRMVQARRLQQTGDKLNRIEGQQQQNISQLQAASMGAGPNIAGDEAQRRAFGMASSGNVAPGQRSALIAQAANNAPQMAAEARAKQMSDARAQLGGALQGATGTVGTQGQVYGNVADLGMRVHEGNQRAAQAAVGANTEIKTGNAKNEGSSVGGMIAAAGGAAAMMSDVRAKEDIEPMYDYSRLHEDEGGGGPGVGQIMSMMGHGMAMSDERSKEKIRALEGALDESRRTAGAIRGADVQYPGAGPSQREIGDSRQNVIDDLQRHGVRDPHTLLDFVNYTEDRRKVGDFDMPEVRARQGIGDANRSADAIRDTRTVYPSLDGPPAARFADLTTPEGSRQALAPVDPYEFRYKPLAAAALGDDTDPRAGVMAQELEESPYLHHAVFDGPGGVKMVDQKRLLSGTAAATAGLDKRLRALEAASGGTERGIREPPVAYPTPRTPY